MKPIDRIIIGVILGVILFAVFRNEGASDSPEGPPISGKGLRVAFVAETADQSKLTNAQKYIATSKVVADYLNEHCAKEKSGQPAWRNFDPQQDASNETKSWQDAMASWKKSGLPTPGMMVSDGKKGVVRPLPKDVDATMVILKKYGGR